MYLITGASGFVGRALSEEMTRRGFAVRRALRTPPESTMHTVDDWVEIGDIGPHTDWDKALEGVRVVIHTAARAHIMHEHAPDSLSAYRRVNVEGTRRLAARARACGVERLVMVSSIKVNGEGRARPYTEDDVPAPQDAYGISKLEAEQALQEHAAAGAMEWVILRPPLVYGPGVKANFLRLLDAVDRGRVLPLGAIHNQRSLVYLGNLVDALCACASHPQARNAAFLVSDDAALSTSDLVHAMARALGVEPRLLPLPPAMLRLAGWITGRSAVVNRLIGSLVIDGRRLRERLGWCAPFTVDQGLTATAAWYRGNSGTGGAKAVGGRAEMRT